MAVMRKSEGGVDVALTVHGLSPYFRLDGAPKTLDLERLDRPQPAVKFDVQANGVDLAKLGVALQKRRALPRPGGGARNRLPRR